jgi:hypothetical protein
MNKFLLASIAVLFYLSPAIAQEPLSPCGTIAQKSVWLQKYQAAPDDFPKNEDTTVYVPLTIHILGNDAGLGFFSYTKFIDAFCTLNEDFEEANIQFYMEGEVNYLSNTAWFEHATVLEGADMMFANNVENTINCYFVSDPASNCGYNLPYAGMAVAKSCANVNDHTWSHEMGHALSLPHPFFGWEGGVSHDDSVPHNFNDPAPLTVLYDYTFFKDTLILDTMIIDTAFVEFVDGSNCEIAADGFCDTAPDYLADRWNCNGNEESSTVQKDPNGVTFQSNGTLIMSYADDACSYRFSLEQIAAMRANLYDEKPHLLYNQTPLEPVVEVAELIAPVDNEIVQFNYAELQWEEVANASHYLIEVSRLQNFPPTLTNSYVSNENSVILYDLLNQKKYYWRVRTFNTHNFCTVFSGKESFETENMVAINEVDIVSSFQIFPTIIQAGAKLNIKAIAIENIDGKVQLFNNLGKLISEQNYKFSSGNNSFDLPISSNIASGLYFITIEAGDHISTKKLIIR